MLFWIFYTTFPCKWVNLSHHQIDFLAVIFPGNISCYFCEKLISFLQSFLHNSFVVLAPKWFFLLQFSLQKTRVIFGKNYIYHYSFPCKRVNLSHQKFDFITVVFLGIISCYFCANLHFSLQSSLHKSFVIFAQNWHFYCTFPCKRLNLSHHQIDFLTVVFFGNTSCYFRANLHFSL